MTTAARQAPKNELEWFFYACATHTFVWDTFEEAQAAASLMLKGSQVLRRICIVAAGADAPDDILSEKSDLLVVRAQDMAPGAWRLVRREEA